MRNRSLRIAHCESLDLRGADAGGTPSCPFNSSREPDKRETGSPGAGIAGHPHSQPNPRYRCFLPDLTEFTRFVIERDPAIASRRNGSLAERVGFEPTVP